MKTVKLHMISPLGTQSTGDRWIHKGPVMRQSFIPSPCLTWDQIIRIWDNTQKTYSVFMIHDLCICSVYDAKHWKPRVVMMPTLPSLAHRTISGATSEGTSQWRHDKRDGISDHQPCDCLLNRLFIRRSKKRHWSLCGVFTCDLRILCTKGQ